MSEEWGPWIEHDGQPVPHLAGMFVHSRHYGPTSRREWERQIRVIHGRGGSWLWAAGFTRIIRYRVRKPRGMAILERIVAQPQRERIDS